jgi:DHA1 family tetracycline resistance protein-like MFS transporter
MTSPESTLSPSSFSASSASSRNSRTPLLMIFFTVLIDMIGFGIVIPILPLYALKFHASPTEIGVLFGSFSLMQLIFAPILGRWSDRIGRRPILVVSILGSALAFTLLGFANSLWMLFLGRMLDGMSGGNISTAQAYIADVTPREKRGAAMGVIGAAFGLGFVIGPAIGGWLGHISIQAPFFVAGALALLNSLGVFFTLPESLSAERRQQLTAPVTKLSDRFAVIQKTGLLPTLICLLFCTMAFSLVTALMTLFTAQRMGWNALENGNLFAFVGVLGILIQGGLLRRLAPKLGEKPLIIVGAVLLLVGMAVLPAVIPGLSPFATVLIGISSLAIGNSLVTPLLAAVASQSADERSQGVVLGITQSVASLARMLGPAFGGILLSMDAANPLHSYGITPFWAAAALMILGLLAALQLRNMRPKTPEELPIGGV